jgi:hypothetical protein
MNLSYFPVGALGGGHALRLLGPDNPGRLAVSRAGAATVLTEALVLAAAPPDTPRFHAEARRLLVEGARTNALLNPRAEGGSTAAYPAEWSSLATVGGITRELGGTGIEAGMPFFQLRFHGTPTASGGNRTGLQSTSAAAAQGQAWTLSAFLRRVAGSSAGTSPVLRLTERNAAGGPVQTNTSSVLAVSDSLGRFSYATTLSSSTVAGITPEFVLNVTSGTPVDVTYRIYLPQMEQAPFASSPMLPAAGGTGASSRAADLPVWQHPGGFGAQGTLVVRAMLPQIAPFGASQGLWQIDDGTDQNRIQLRNTSAGSAITGVVEIGGNTLATLSAGNMVPGTPFRAAFAWAPGDQALCLNGGEAQAATAALPAGLTRLLVGHASTQLNRAAFGEVELVDYRPTRLPNAMLQALSGAA